MGSLPREKAGVGSAMNDTTRQTGGAIGVAVFGSVMASKYRSAVLRAAGLAHLTPKIAAAAAANVGQAVALAHSGAAGASSAVVGHIARDSFVSAFHTAVLVGAAVMLVATAGVAMWLPARARDEEPAMAGETIGDEPIESLGAVAGVLGVEVAVDG
jgi:DHA2 family multidrug resistance protein-like MFS transporter